MENQEEGICVAIRMRGLNEREIKSGSTPIFKCLSNERVALLNEKDGHPIERDTYQYDKVFDAKADTVNIYNHVGRNLVEGVVTGINATIFAYGQTSSGKTYTMLGAQGSQGVLELAATDLFRHIGATSTRDFIVRVSFVEIYNEVIRDLLSDAADSTVNIREDPRKGVYCEASEHAIQDFDSVMKVLNKGVSRRAVESTAMNSTSSRSHTIFKITVESIESQSQQEAGEERDMSVLVASLNLVDLAGSESVRHTGATGQRAKEGGKINQSLLSLSRVIHSLSQPGTHVSFRDSKLTRLLQPSLCGNAKMSIVCCVTPAEKYIEETRSTLQFASRAKLVQTNATVNEILDESEKIRRLTKELKALKEREESRGTVLSDSERESLQADKHQLQSRLESLQNEKDEQRDQLLRMQERMFEMKEELPSMEGLDNLDIKMKKKRKTKRDTWCPGSDVAGPSFLEPFQPLSAPLSLLPIQEANRSLRSSLDSQENEQSGEVARLSAEVAALQHEVKQSKELIFTLQSQEEQRSDSKDNSSTELSEEVVALTAANSDLQNSLDEASVRIEELTYQRDDFEERLDLEMGANQETEQQFDQLKGELQEEVTRLKELVEGTERENTRLQGELDNANETLHGQLEFSLMEEAAAAQSRAESLEREKKELREQVDAKSAKIVELLSSLSAAEESVMAQQQQEVMAAEREASALKIALEAALSECEEKLKVASAECDRLVSEAAVQDENLDTLLSEKTQMSEMLTAAESQASAHRLGWEESEKEVQELKDQLEGLQSSAQQKDTTQQEMKALREAHAEELDGVFKDLEESEDAMEALEKDKLAAEEEVASLKEQLRALQAELLENGEQKADVQSVMYEQTNELRALQAKVKDMAEQQAGHESVLEKSAALEEEVKCSAAAKDELQRRLDEAVLEVDQTQASLQSTEEELLGVSSDIVMKEAEVDALSTELEELRQAQAGMEETAAAMTARTDELQLEVSRLMDAAAASEELRSTDLSELREQLASEQSSVSSLKEELLALQSAHTEETASLQRLLEEKEQQHAETLLLLEESAAGDEALLLLRDEFSSSQARLEEVCLEKEAAEEKVAELAAELAVHEEKLESSARELAAAVIELTAEREASSLRIKELCGELIALREEQERLEVEQGDLSGADDLICELQARATLLEKDLADQELQTEVLQQSHVLALQEAREEGEAGKAAVEERLHALGAESQKQAEALQQELDSLREVLGHTEEELLLKEKDLEGLSGELESLKDAATASVDGSNAHAVELSNVQMSAQHSVSVLEQRVAELEQELASVAQDAVGSATDLEHHQKDFTTELQRLNSLIGQRDGEISRLMAEVVAFTDRASTAEASLSLSRQQESEAGVDGDAQAKRCRQLQTQVDLLLSERDSLSTKVTESESERKKEQHAAADTEYKLVAEVDSLRAQVGKMSEGAQAASMQQQSLVALERALATASADLSAVREEREGALETVRSLESDNAALQLRASFLQDATRLQDQLESAVEEKAALEGKLQEAQLQQGEMETRVKRTRADLTCMTEEVGSLTEQMASLEAERDELLLTVETLQQQQQDEQISERMAEYEEEAAGLKGSVEVLETENASLQQSLAAAVAELEGRASEHGEKSEENAAALSELRQELSEAELRETSLSEQFSQERGVLISRVETLQQEQESLLVGAAEKRAQQMAIIDQLEAVLVTKDKEIALLTAAAAEAASAVKGEGARDEHLQQLISEMNTLMEQKMEAEGKIQSAEGESKALRAQLSDYDRKSSKEVAMMMEAAQAEMDFLKSSFDKERAEGHSQIESLRGTIAALEEAAEVSVGSNSVALEAELDEAIASNNQLQMQNHEAEEAQLSLKSELKQLQKKLTLCQTEAASAAEVKDQRIARLEKSKLTTDQMQKIKQVRENCTKKTEECKVYKKQLSQLKAAYETLQGTLADSDISKRSTRSSAKEKEASHSSADRELASLKLSHSETESQLEQANFVSKTLKQKLKDCSRQLQEHEQERQAIVVILEECDIDVAGLLLQDESNVEESVLEEQELSEPVSRLAQKWRQVQSLNSSLRGQVSDAEDRFLALSSEVESSRTHKMTLEKKLASAKSALASAKQEQEDVLVQAETAREQLRVVESELAVAKSSLTGSEEAVCTEIQVLEEENIELLRENKDLRIASSTYRAKAEALARKLDSSAEPSADVKKRCADALQMDPAAPSPVVVKRVKENDENEIGTQVTATDHQKQKQATPARSFGTSLDENTLNRAATPSQVVKKPDSVVKPAVGGRRGRRVKAKAVETPSTDSSEQPGECAQS